MIVRLHLIALVTLLLGSWPALSETPKTSEDHSSRGHRSRSTYSIQVQPIGFDAGYASAIMAEYFLDPDILLGLRYQGSNDSGITASHRRAHSNQFAATAKFFMANSLYLSTGLAGMKQTADSKDKWYWDDDIQSEKRYTREEVAALFGLGNQWQLNRITIGCEWFGFYQPLTAARIKGHKWVYQDDGSVIKYTLDEKDSDRKLQLRLVNFHVGIAF